MLFLHFRISEPYVEWLFNYFEHPIVGSFEAQCQWGYRSFGSTKIKNNRTKDCVDGSTSGCLHFLNTLFLELRRIWSMNTKTVTFAVPIFGTPTQWITGLFITILWLYSNLLYFWLYSNLLYFHVSFSWNVGWHWTLGCFCVHQ